MTLCFSVGKKLSFSWNLILSFFSSFFTSAIFPWIRCSRAKSWLQNLQAILDSFILYLIFTFYLIFPSLALPKLPWLNCFHLWFWLQTFKAILDSFSVFLEIENTKFWFHFFVLFLSFVWRELDSFAFFDVRQSVAVAPRNS